MKDTDYFYKVPVLTEGTFEYEDADKGKKVLKIQSVDTAPDGRVRLCNAVDLKTGKLLFVADTHLISFNRQMTSGS